MDFKEWLSESESLGDWAKLQQLLGQGQAGGPLLAWKIQNYTVRWHEMLRSAMKSVGREKLMGWIDPFQPTPEIEAQIQELEASRPESEDWQAEDEWRAKWARTVGERIKNYRNYLQEIYDKLTNYQPGPGGNPDNPFDSNRSNWPVTDDPS